MAALTVAFTGASLKAPRLPVRASKAQRVVVRASADQNAVKVSGDRNCPRRIFSF